MPTSHAESTPEYLPDRRGPESNETTRSQANGFKSDVGSDPATYLSLRIWFNWIISSTASIPAI
jgi:hypothetical protein